MKIHALIKEERADCLMDRAVPGWLARALAMASTQHYVFLATGLPQFPLLPQHALQLRRALVAFLANQVALPAYLQDIPPYEIEKIAWLRMVMRDAVTAHGAALLQAPHRRRPLAMSRMLHTLRTSTFQSELATVPRLVLRDTVRPHYGFAQLVLGVAELLQHLGYCRDTQDGLDAVLLNLKVVLRQPAWHQ